MDTPRDRRARDFRAIAATLLDDFAARRPIRAGSLVISLFGDAIVPRGGSVWLGSVIEALAPFGISDRLVRTSVSRLAKQGWLDGDRIGRRSFYHLTERGLRRFEAASRRIYAEPASRWTGDWCLALIGGAEAEVREQLRRELGWQGFAGFSRNVLAHPGPDLRAVEESLGEIAGAESVLLMQARVTGSRSEQLRATVRTAWELDDLDQRYAAFLDTFRPARAAAEASGSLDPRLAFCARLLLVHEYRRILLRDPSLPRELLPAGWNGAGAYQLCRNLYARLAGPADDYVSERLENANGSLPPPDASYFLRFGGLGARDADERRQPRRASA